MKKLSMVLAVLVMSVAMVGCSGGYVADYTTEEFEQALINGEDVTGKRVVVKVKRFEPQSAFGFNMIAGENLNFVSAENPNVQEGDEIVVTVDRVASMMGSFIITYTK